MKRNYCKNCIHKEINFWEYEECWKFNQKIDVDIADHTADRESTAKKLNYYTDCPHFKKNSLMLKVVEFLKNIFDFENGSLP